jgi:hypothetical protein
MHASRGPGRRSGGRPRRCAAEIAKIRQKNKMSAVGALATQRRSVRLRAGLYWRDSIRPEWQLAHERAAQRCLDAERGVNDGRETIGPVMAALGEAADARAPSYTFSSQAKAIHIMVRC